MNNNTTPIAIDSCSIFVPIKLLSSYNRSFDHSIATMTLETGEIDVSNIKQKADITIHNAGYTTYYKRKLTRRGRDTTIDGIAISITSKHLQSHYATGITAETLPLLHQSIIAENQISISYEDFIQCWISDVDLKVDTILPQQYKTFTEFSKSIYAARDKTVFGQLDLIKHYARKDNQGINFGSRSTSTTLPHFKIYNKQVELEHNSTEFNAEYKPAITHPVRYEVNFKNIKQLRKYGLLGQDQAPTLATIITTMETFSMRTILQLYIAGTITPKTAAEKLDTAIKRKKIELQALNVAREFADLAPHWTNQQIIDKTIQVLMPTKNDIKNIRYLLIDTLDQEQVEILDPALSSALDSLFSI